MLTSKNKEDKLILIQINILASPVFINIILSKEKTLLSQKALDDQRKNRVQ